MGIRGWGIENVRELRSGEEEVGGNQMYRIGRGGN